MPIDRKDIIEMLRNDGIEVSDKPFNPFEATYEELAEARFSGAESPDPQVNLAFALQRQKEREIERIKEEKNNKK